VNKLGIENKMCEFCDKNFKAITDLAVITDFKASVLQHVDCLTFPNHRAFEFNMNRNVV
jgi:hypothetical protein